MTTTSMTRLVLMTETPQPKLKSGKKKMKWITKNKKVCTKLQFGFRFSSQKHKLLLFRRLFPMLLSVSRARSDACK